MKPYLTIKKVKDKKYVQIHDLSGNLIHIGPASKAEIGTIAYQALKNAYEGFVLEEFIALKGTADEEEINLMDAIDAREYLQESESWQAFRAKQKKKRHETFVTRMLWAGIDVNDPRLLETINKRESEFQACERTAEIVGVSPECVEWTEKVFKLYEPEPSPN